MPVLNKHEKSKIKKPADKLLAFLAQHATTPCRSSNNIRKRFKCQIPIKRFQTVSSIRDLAKATGYTKKTVEYHIKLLRELDLIIAQPINWKNRCLGTLFTLNFVNKKSSKKNLGDIEKPVQIYDKNYNKFMG
jgi:DNA-binding transcriptional ArsR family regulator